MQPTQPSRKGPGQPPGGNLPHRPQQQQSVSGGGSSIPVPTSSLPIPDQKSSRRVSHLPQRAPTSQSSFGLRKPQARIRSIVEDKDEKCTTEIIQKPVEPPTKPVVDRSEDTPPPPLSQAPPSHAPEPEQTTRAEPLRTLRRTERLASRSKSPVKRQLQTNPKSTVPTKTASSAALPQVRPTRSASLRQASSAKPSDASTAAKGHTRHRSQIIGHSISATLRPTDKSNPIPGSTKIAHQPRPQFTTYQQSFSPKKKETDERRHATKSAAPSQGGEGSSPPRQIAGLQIELLQMYLLRSAMIRQHAEWTVSTEHRLRHRFSEVTQLYRQCLDQEKEKQERLNLEALAEWSTKSADFQQDIQTFSRLTQEIANMTLNDNGAFASIVRVFEDWLNRVERIEHRRRQNPVFDSEPQDDDDDDDDDDVIIEPLGSVWRSDVDELILKAERCSRELASVTIFTILDETDFGTRHSASALVQAARGFRNLLALTTDELKSMRQVELATVKRENAWIARAADQLEIATKHPRSGIWQSIN